MNLVIDTNIFIASLLRDGKIRELIVNSPFNLIIPEAIYEEIIEHKEELILKSRLDEEDFNTVSSLISKYVTIIPDTQTKTFKEKAKEIIGHIDKDDIPIIATSLKFNFCPIWTDDSDFKKQDKIKIFTTKEIIDFQQ